MGTVNETKRTRSFSGYLLAGVIAAVLGAGSFFLALNYFTYKRSLSEVIVARDISGSSLTAYRPKGPESFTNIPLAERVTVVDAAGKKLTLESLELGPGKEKVVKVRVRPDGKVVKIEELPSRFTATGEIRAVDGDSITLGDRRYAAGEALFLASGKVQGRAGLTGLIGEGDMVRVLGHENTALLVEVVEKAGSLSFVSNVEGARVFADGTYRGKTPCTFRISPGTKDILVRAEGYKDLRLPVTVEPLKETKVTVTLERVTGTLKVTSNPSGAAIYVGGELKGRTPLTLNVPPGEYEVTAKLEGFYPKSAKVRIVQDREQFLSFTLAKVASGVPGGSIQNPGDVPGEKVIVERTWPNLGVLEVKDPRGSLLRLAISENVPLERLPFGRISWDRVMPGEELVIETDPEGNLKKATRIYAHSFSTEGKIMFREGNKIFVGEGWTECLLRDDAIVHSGTVDVPLETLSVGDTVAVYGASPQDIRFVDLKQTLGEKAAFEGFLVKTSTGLRIFSDYSLTWFTVPSNLEVADPVARVTDNPSRVPSGSRLRFYINPVGDVVWAEYVWKAGASLEGRVGLIAGASLHVMPGWQEVFISEKTSVFLDREKRPYYDVKVGDLVLAAGPSGDDIRFIWVEDRLLYVRTGTGFIGAKDPRGGRIFYELPSSGQGEPYPRLLDTKITFSYPAQRKSLSLRELSWGDKVKLFFDEEGRVVWGEVVEANEIKLLGHYLGTQDGFYYFTGFSRFAPGENIVVIGLSEGEKLTKGSRVFVGGKGNIINYLEVDNLVRPERWVLGTVLSVAKGSMRLLSGQTVQELKVSKDAWFCDWNAREDGDLLKLFPGDRVSVALGKEGTVLYVERSYSPPFKIEGSVTYAQGRVITVSGKNGTSTIVIDSGATVYRGGRKVGPWSIQKGDKVKASGSSKDSVDLVVSGW